MSQQEEEPSRYTRTLVVKPALSQMYDQLLPTSKSLEIACKHHCTGNRRPVTCVYLDLGISQTVNTANESRFRLLRLYSLSQRQAKWYSYGGLLVYARSQLRTTRRQDLECPDIECLTLELNLRTQGKILLFFCYRPPDFPPTCSFRNFLTD